MTFVVVSSPWASAVTSHARRLWASRRNGSSATFCAYSSISARVRNVKTLSRSTTSASAVLSQNW